MAVQMVPPRTRMACGRCGYGEALKVTVLMHSGRIFRCFLLCIKVQQLLARKKAGAVLQVRESWVLLSTASTSDKITTRLPLP